MSNPSLFPETEAAAPAAAQASAAPGQTQSLYRKYRPQSFDAEELVGQEHVVRTLRNAIALGRVAHAYLFCGPRGTGKTTTARLLAKAVNCLDPDPQARPCNRCANCQAITTGATTDVIEIDAASNRGIDDIRDLRERVKYAPTHLQTKFYIIDEAHQITGAAANAFLKTLEEPPPHTKFVLATTDPEELLPTIVSRCQRFDFRRIGVDAIVARLRTVATAEGLEVEDDALRVIARHATGSLRDALGLLDQLAVYGQDAGDGERRVITADDARALLGVSRNDRVETLVTALAEKDTALALGAINAAVEAGEDPRQLNRQLVAYLRVLLHTKAGDSLDADERAKELAQRFELLELAELARLFSEVDYRIRHSSYQHLPLEVALVEATLRGTTRASAAPAGTRQATSAPAAEPAMPPPPTAETERRPAGPSLRDRVRGSAPSVQASAPAPAPAAMAQAATPRPAAAPPATPAAPATPSGEAVVTVEQLAELWPRIRLEIKAINRRIEALLTSIDPHSVQGDQIILVSPYAFHRDRLNTDEVRAVVEDVISRVVRRRVRVCCVLRGEAPPTAVSAQSASAPAVAPQPVVAEEAPQAEAVSSTPATSEPPAEPDSTDERDAERIAAAKNIFDAEEIT
ncbi:MAG TPA: DNA polymerase III subunit gamma/tau [Thermomicrobiales bacterium]